MKPFYILIALLFLSGSASAVSWVDSIDANCIPDTPNAASTEVISAKAGKQYCQRVSAATTQTMIEILGPNGCQGGFSISTEDAVTLTVETCRLSDGTDCSNYTSATLAVVVDVGDYLAFREIDGLLRYLRLNVSAVASTADITLACIGESRK